MFSSALCYEKHPHSILFNQDEKRNFTPVQEAGKAIQVMVLWVLTLYNDVVWTMLSVYSGWNGDGSSMALRNVGESSSPWKS